MESGKKDDVHEYTSEDMDDLDGDDFRQRDSWVDVRYRYSDDRRDTETSESQRQ